MFILNLGTYPPKECGIATFSQDLRDNLLRSGTRVSVAAVSDSEYTYDYPDEVLYEINQMAGTDYSVTARQINRSNINLVIIQHEYGIFGGLDGEYILDFVRRLDKPYLLVAHTVLPNPSQNQRFILNRLAQKASGVICMTERATRILSRVYAVSPKKVSVIYHGVPLFQEKRREMLKKREGLNDRRVITTFGLIGPGKGLETGITAIRKLAAKHPDVLYLIAGKTHPMLLKRDGERYREMLLGLIKNAGLENHVKFINRFLDTAELGDYLYMTDIYLSPYPNPDQAVSGTLAFAIGCGRAIVSTPYEYAREMLAGDRGLLAAEATPEALGILLDKILSNPELQANLEKKTAQLGKTLKWPFVAEQYANLAKRVIQPVLRGSATRTQDLVG